MGVRGAFRWQSLCWRQEDPAPTAGAAGTLDPLNDPTTFHKTLDQKRKAGCSFVPFARAGRSAA